MEIYQSVDGSEIAVLAATWELNPKITFASLASEFQSNPLKASRNYASIVKHNIEAAIKDFQVVLNHVNVARSHPWDPAREKFYEWFRGVPGRKYFVHIDIGIRKDNAGIAMSHRERDGRGVVDFMHQIVVPFGRDISIPSLREWVYEFTRRGFNVVQVSYDGYQSEESRQVLTEKGYKTEYISIDKTPKPYDTLIEMITPEPTRLDFYQYPVFIREMKNLKLLNGMKYDHPKRNDDGTPGSKDVADAVAGSVFAAINYELENEETPPAAIKVHTNPNKMTFGERSRF